MRPTVCAAVGILWAACAAGECEVVFRFDFDGEEERPAAFTSGGEYPHPENRAMGHSVVLTDELDYEDKPGGKSIVLRAGKLSGEPWYGGRELWFVADKVPTKDLRLSVCIHTEGVKSVQPISPVDGADDNCYNLSVRVRHEGKTAGTWAVDPGQFLDDGEWGPVTWKIYENRFNSTHVRINPRMHCIDGFRLHPAGWGGNERTAVAVDNLALYRGDDASPPAAAADLSASASDGVVRLAWSRPEDNLFAVSYDVYRSAAPDVALSDENLLAHVHTTHFTDETIVNPGEYDYRVVACDYAGNRSPGSNVAAVSLDDNGKTVGRAHGAPSALKIQAASSFR